MQTSTRTPETNEEESVLDLLFSSLTDRSEIVEALLPLALGHEWFAWNP